ncbi:Neurotransmitter-gated ion-channel ligand binding domain protein, partial [Teladorsagia circumcincta]
SSTSSRHTGEAIPEVTSPVDLPNTELHKLSNSSMPSRICDLPRSVTLKKVTFENDTSQFVVDRSFLGDRRVLVRRGSGSAILPRSVTQQFAPTTPTTLRPFAEGNYDHFERPVENSSMPLDVKVRFLLNQILDVDEKNQVMSILAYIDFYLFTYNLQCDVDISKPVCKLPVYGLDLQMHWNDYKLRWDPKMFGGVRDVRFAGEQDAPFKLWKPDVLLFNSVSEAFDSTYSSRFIVNYDGHIQQNPPGIFRFICKVDVTYYPFDTQTCFLKLGSWTYSGRYINLDFMLTTMIG